LTGDRNEPSPSDPAAADGKRSADARFDTITCRLESNVALLEEVLEIANQKSSKAISEIMDLNMRVEINGDITTIYSDMHSAHIGSRPALTIATSDFAVAVESVVKALRSAIAKLSVTPANATTTEAM
jgi:hypothetical protein